MEPFKNLLGFAAAQKIANAIHRANPHFNDKVFLKDLEAGLSPLELKARMLHIKNRLAEQLPANPKAFPTLVNALKKNDDDAIGLSGFLVWPLTQFVAEYGLNDFEKSLTALKEMTKVFTAEFAVRPFFLKDEDHMLQTFRDWANDPNEHVRRLVSEGSRPLLPWGQKLPRFLENPKLTWPLLTALKNDQSKYVQKSVANHMNDLSKAHGDWLTEQLKNWPNPWVAKHAVRTLVKKGHPGALKIIGADLGRLKITNVMLRTKKLKVGQNLLGSVKLKNPGKKTVRVMIDVEIDFLKSRGQHAAKVFKGKKITLPAGTGASGKSARASQKVELCTPIKKVTTRVYHPGVQYWRLVINGKKTARKKFILG